LTGWKPVLPKKIEKKSNFLVFFIFLIYISREL
jgi:hypothetical protein